MRCFVVLSLLILTNLSCKPDPNASVANGNHSASATDDDLFYCNQSSEEADTSETSVEELLDLIHSSTNDKFEQSPPVPFDPPLTATEINSVLQQCLHQILTEPEFKHSREFYGTLGDTDVVLRNDYEPAWPANFSPKVNGYDLRFDKSKPVEYEGNRILGIRLEKLDVTAPSPGFGDGNIILVMSNAGGTKNGMIIGGCLIYFTVHRQGDTYIARFSGLRDP